MLHSGSNLFAMNLCLALDASLSSMRKLRPGTVKTSDKDKQTKTSQNKAGENIDKRCKNTKATDESEKKERKKEVG